MTDSHYELSIHKVVHYVCGPDLNNNVDGGGYAKRVTYVLDGSGKIIIVDGNVNTSTQATDILARL